MENYLQLPDQDVKTFAGYGIDLNSLLIPLVQKDFETYGKSFEQFIAKYFSSSTVEETVKFMNWLLISYLSLYQAVCPDDAYNSLTESSLVYLGLIENPQGFAGIEHGSEE